MREVPGALVRLPAWSGPVFTVAALALGHVLWRTIFPEARFIPGAAFAPTFLAVVLSTFTAGRRSGFMSAGLATAYVAALAGFSPEMENFARLTLIALTLYACVVLVAHLKSQAERALEVERSSAARERRNAAEAARANTILRANNETLETFVYVITHDLKEPVRAIDHHLQTALDKPASADGQTAIAEAAETNRRLGVLLQRLLEYSRASLTTPAQRPLTLREVLDDSACRAIYDHMVRIRRARLEVSESGRAFLGDPTLLGQCLGNLILNAVKHNTKEEPSVVVLLRDAGQGTVEVIIQDDGPGFPDALLRRFDALKPGRPATVRGGFGLVIARRALERLGGTMTIRNLSAGGAEVRLRLPAEDAPDAVRVRVAAGSDASTSDDAMQAPPAPFG